MRRPIRVLVVDDDELNAQAHAAYVGRVAGFQVAGVAHTGAEALHLLQASLGPNDRRIGRVDLILLDMNLPDLSGIEICRRIRSAGVPTDIIAVTAVRDVAMVREAMSLGVLLYLMKPFTFATFADKLKNYEGFRAGFADDGTIATQSQVDQAIASLRGPTQVHPEKGLTEETLSGVLKSVGVRQGAATAAELATELGISRVTARRYLEHLVTQGLLERGARYGSPGRPEIRYRPRRTPEDG